MITKPEGTGGLVSVGTVTEQLLYEIDDPARYRTPDVDVDFTTVELDEQGPDRVAVRGTHRAAAGDRLKLAAVYRDGWTASGMLAVVGRDAEAKAHAAGLDHPGAGPPGGVTTGRFAGRVSRRRATSCPGVLRPPAPPFEVVLRVTVRDPDRAAVERFCRELAPLVTVGPAGDRRLCDRPAHRPGRRSATGRRSSRVAGRGPGRGPDGGRVGPASWSPRGMSIDATGETTMHTRPRVRLGDLAHARSGDKGNRANIGVVANDDACYAWLKMHLTESRRGGLPSAAGDRRGPAV